ncbi:copper resistance CopC family protein [Actinokineospora sp. UTMC 2448]|uniref:copper resistance CopC family protein n=1 Tax=Actinokineospora sp. UTMC 2448 TaxID=2268449 RepID=UPI002164D0F8|nr:copper resistance CopC family protein [Actinokineospora sp. UTMC 2448]UVS80097.1 Copper resistance protein CopC [Actinokineospora sp. UTMC 2448]
MHRRLTVAAVAVAAALLAGAPPAAAHVELESSDPAQGAALSSAPSAVTLTFSGPVAANPESVRVTAPDGSAWRVSDVEASGSVVTAAVVAAGPAGVHGLAYRVTSDDGHIVTGTIRFTLARPAPTTPPSTTAPATTATITTATITTGAPTTTSAAPVSVATPSAPAEDTEDGGGLPAWFWVLFSAVLVWGALWLFRARRS